MLGFDRNKDLSDWLIYGTLRSFRDAALYIQWTIQLYMELKYQMTIGIICIPELWNKELDYSDLKNHWTKALRNV